VLGLTPYRFHTEAEEELDESTSFYGSRVLGLGKSFVLEVERTVTAVRENPDIGTRPSNHKESPHARSVQ
jgi:hypothetical protein